MAAAAIIGLSCQPRKRIEYSGCKRNAEGIVKECPKKVFLNIAYCSTAQADGCHRVKQVALHQDDVCRLYGYVRSCTDCYANISAGQCGSIVNTVADHRHMTPAFLNPANFAFFILRKHFSNSTVNVKLPAYCFRCFFIVACQHYDVNPHGFQLAYGFPACRLHRHPPPL